MTERTTTDNPSPPLRKHLMAMHAVEEFDPEATEVSLAAFHEWDHETGLVYCSENDKHT